MRRSVRYLLIDLILIAVATVSAVLLRDNLETTLDRLQGLLPYLGLTLAVAVPVLMISGLNRTIWRRSGMIDYTTVVVAVAVIVPAAVALGFLANRLDGVARTMPVLQAIIMVALLVGARVLTRERHRVRRSAPALMTAMPGAPGGRETVLVIGLNRITELYLESLAEFAADSVAVAGLLGQAGRHTGRLVRRHAVLGTPEEVATVLRDLEMHGVTVDRIVLMSPFEKLGAEAQRALLEIERTSSIRLDPFAEHMVLDSRGRSQGASRDGDDDETMQFSIAADDLVALAERPYWRIKRAIDVLAALVLVVLTAPLAILVALLVAADVGLPVIFWQQRPGADGRPFRLYKLRTMGPSHDRTGRRLSDVERLSLIGRILRRTRLDELPQLYHILIGEMSFVGPRPLLPIDQPAAYSARLLIRPGLTGWAQVMGGRTISAADKAALDVWYIQNASLALDLEIAARTAWMVVFGEQVHQTSIRQAWSDLVRSGICSDRTSSTNSRRVA